MFSAAEGEKIHDNEKLRITLGIMMHHKYNVRIVTTYGSSILRIEAGFVFLENCLK